MVSSPHEALHRMFQLKPGLLNGTFRVLGTGLPESTATNVLNADLTEIEPVERRVDTLLQIDTAEGNFLVVIEAQGKQDPKKPGSWSYYLSYLYAKYGLHPILLVTTQDSATARWAARPVRLGLPSHPSLTLTPLVLGPDNVPEITEEKQVVEDPWLAAFSVVTHAKSKNTDAILTVVATAFDKIDPDTAVFLTDYIEGGLGDTPAREKWKALVSTLSSFFKSETAQKALAETREEGREEGRAEERAEAVLKILQHRDVEVPEAVSQRIRSCTDLELLSRWQDRAWDVTDAESLFDDH